MSRSKKRNLKSKQRAHGQYANHYRIGHNAYEFVIDFGQLYEGDNEGRFHTRIVTNPRYAKELRNLLSISIKTYEESFGAIKED